MGLKRRFSASHAFLLRVAPMGGKVFDDSWNPVVNNAAGVTAANALKTIVGRGPEGAASFECWQTES